MVRPLSVEVRTDLDHGGRWTSLLVGGRQWLWSRRAPGRHAAGPGDGFVDAGGLEECIPTVRGIPDHGDAWCRRWQRVGDADIVVCPSFVLHRRLACTEAGVEASYRLSADPGFRFVWAAHALLDLSAQARLVAAPGTPTRLYPEAAALLEGPWPDGAPYVTGRWPEPGGLPMDRLGPDDGTAIGAILVGCHTASVVDGPDRLSLTLHADAATPVSLALWRNLGGFPPGAPYRSIGVEPMLGAMFDLADAGPSDAARVPSSGAVEWRLEITGGPAWGEPHDGYGFSPETGTDP